MRNIAYYPTLLLGVLLLIVGSQLRAQESDSTIEQYWSKIESQDSARFYGQRLYDYTFSKVAFTEYHLKSCLFLCETSSERFDAPSNRPFFQSIFKIVTSDFPLGNNARFSGFRILGDYYHDLLEINQSLKYYHHALNMVDTSATKIKDAYLSVLYTNLSDLYLNLNEFNKARLLIEKTIDIDTSIDTPSKFLAFDYHNLAVSYRQMSPEKSLTYFLKSKNEFRKAFQKGEKIWQINQYELLYIFVADNYLALNNPAQALVEIDTALTITKYKNGKSNLTYAKALETKAAILQYIGEYPNAIQYHHMADKFLKDKQATIVYRPKILLQKARCYLEMNQPKKAYNQIEQAFYLIDQSGDLGQSRFDKALFPEELFQLYFEEARILSKWYTSNPEINLLYRSQKAYQNALMIFEKMKQTVSDQQSRQVFMKNNAAFFESAIDLNFKLWEKRNDSTALKKILLLSEKSKNSFLYESLNKTNTSLTKELPDSVLTQIQSLDLRISQTEKKLFEAQSKNQKNNISSIRDNLIKYREDQKIQMEDIEKNYPEFHQLKYDISVPTVAELQNKLLPEEGVISYYVGTHHLYVLLVDKWDFSVERIPMDFSLSEKIDTFNHSILSSTGKTPSAKRALKTYHETGFFLYQKLIGPFARKLPARLTILPDNVLENLSFDALLTEVPSRKTSYQNYPFLLKKYTISYQYSADAICRPSVYEKKYSDHFLAFAPTFPNDKSSSIAQLRDLGQLTHNGQEVDNIKKIIGSGTVLKNTNATEDNFMKLAPNYQIIHLATHGKVNAEHADYSYLAFQEIKDSLENELLYIKDIYGLQLNANLVVLSACETANGSLAKGEGIINLARGFTYAGASSVVPTLWKISDVATAKLMEKFYTELKAGQPKHIAMARAKHHYLETASAYSGHPFYWAAFVLIGDVSPIDLPATTSRVAQTNSLWWGTGIVFFLLFLSVLRFLRNRL